MAFLAPAIRWPDALQTHLHNAGLLDPTSLQPSPILLFSTALGFIIITTALTYTFRATPRAITAQPVSVSTRANDSDEKTRSKKKQPLSTALLGPQGTGKTALYSTLLYGQTPHTQTSQQSSSVQLVLSAEGEGVKRKANVVLHDVPGHPRLRPLGKHVQIVMGADVLLFCVDTVGALGGGASSSSGAGAAGTETFGAAVDYLHSTLMSLARQRLSSSNKNKPASPPAFAILLTRADLSPLLASTSSSAKDQETDEIALAARAKRHQAASAVLLSRARTALESELRKRRAADVDLASAASASASVAGAQSKAKIGGMGEVARGEGESDGGVLKQVLGLFGLGGILGSSSKGGGGLVDEDEGGDAGGDGDGVLDYYLGAGVGGGGGGGGSSSFSLEKLDPEVVLDGEVPILLSTVGRERGWEAGGASAAVGSGAGFDGLGELKKWIVDLV